MGGRIALIVVVLLAGCSEQAVEPQAGPTGAAEPTVTASTAAPRTTSSAAPSPAGGGGHDLQVVQVDAARAAQQGGIDADGAVQGLRFQDDNGVNVVVLRRPGPDEDPSLRVDHVLVEPVQGAPRRLREVRDADEECDAGEGAEFLPAGDQSDGSLAQVHDDDGDGRGEVHFAYRLTCATGVDTWNLKLLVLEDGEKYILRGQTGISGQTPDPTPEPDPEAWPDGSHDRASTRFRELQSEFCVPGPECPQ